MSYVQKAMKGFVTVFLFSLLAGALGYILRVLMARKLTPEDFGLFTAVFTFFWFASYFREWGFHESLAKFIPEFQAKKKLKELAAMLRIAVHFEWVLALLIGGIIFLSADFLAERFFNHPGAALGVKIFAFFFPLQGIKEHIRLLFQGFQKMFLFSFYYFLENILLVASFLIIFSYFVADFSAAFLAYLAAYALLVLFGLWQVYSYAYRKKRLGSHNLKFWLPLTFLSHRPSRRIFRDLFRFGFALVIGGIASMVYLYTDTLVLTYFRPLSEVGIYGVAVVAAMTLTFISRPIVQVIFPMISELNAQKQYQYLREGIALLNKYTLLAVLPVGMVFFANAEVLLRLVFGEEYVVGANTLRILIVATFFLVIGLLNLNVLTAMGKPKTSRNLGLIAAAVNLVLNLLFIPVYGMLAAALTTLLSYLLLFAFSLLALGRGHKKPIHGFDRVVGWLATGHPRVIVKLPWSHWLRMFVAALFCLLVIHLSKGFLTHFWLRLTLPVFLGGIVYLLLLLLFRVVTLEDYQFFKGHLRTMLRRSPAQP